MKRADRAIEPTGTGDSGAAKSPVPVALKFIVDVNVGKLAKWLRILGFDTLFINPIDDGDLVEIARREGRVVLTRDTHIDERRVVTSGQVRVVEVEGDTLREQLSSVSATLGLRGPFPLFSRCLEDNSLLVPIDKEQLGGRVPPYVFRTQDRYMICPRCGRIYWPGTHWERMREMVGAVVDL